MDHDKAIVEDNIDILRQGINLIEKIGSRLYSVEKLPFSKNSIGSHFRHCIDFYNIFLTSLEKGKINYALRKRNLFVETDCSVAILEIEAIIKNLPRISPDDLRKQVHVILEDLPNHLAPSAWSGSTVMRELQFLLSHTTHHYAIIALALRFHGFNPSDEFGVAKSTLGYWRKTA